MHNHNREGSNFPCEKALLLLLEGREARRDLQKELLLMYPWVLQISLNLPGLPKELPGDGVCLEATEKVLFLRIPSLKKARRIFCENGAGKALLLGGKIPSREEVKKICVALEEELPWGRLLDLDVLSSEGALSRKDFELPPRRCLLCGEEAKICARQGSHSFEELRRRGEELLALVSPSPSC